jgi:hypothetical protein
VRALAWGPGETTEVAAEQLRYRATVRVPEDYAGFDGHFPGVPILAGVLQLHDIVMPGVRAARAALGPLVRLTRLKFLKPIGPGDALALDLLWAAGDDAVDFALLRDGASLAGGRLHFGPAPSAPADGEAA